MSTLLIKVKPNASKDEISIDAGNNISVRIKAKPIDGEANDYLIKYLAEELDISKSLINIEKGATSRLKKITIALEQDKLNLLLAKYRK